VTVDGDDIATTGTASARATSSSLQGPRVLALPAPFNRALRAASDAVSNTSACSMTAGGEGLTALVPDEYCLIADDRA